MEFRAIAGNIKTGQKTCTCKPTLEDTARAVAQANSTAPAPAVPDLAAAIRVARGK